MSAAPSTSSLKLILQSLGKWTPDSLKRYASFKDIQTSRYEALLAGPQARLNAHHLQLQAKALETLVSNANKTKFAVSEKLTKPSTNPIYYERLINELTPGKPKVPMLTAIKHVVFGGYN
jgi:cytochrome b pre-mRNA-processing protein 6